MWTHGPDFFLGSALISFNLQWTFLASPGPAFNHYYQCVRTEFEKGILDTCFGDNGITEEIRLIPSVRVEGSADSLSTFPGRIRRLSDV